MLKWLLLYAIFSGVCGQQCRVVEKMYAQVERQVQKEGLHRLVHTQASVSSPLLDLTNCTLAIKEHLLRGVYFDPDELRRMQDESVPPHVLGSNVNIEAGEWDAVPLSILFFPKLSHQGDDKSWSVNFSAPLHIRYHRARSSTHQTPVEIVRVPHPSVLLSCPHLDSSCQLESLPCPPDATMALLFPPSVPSERKSSDASPFHEKAYHPKYDDMRQCSWIPVNSFSTSEDLALSIPVGDSDLLQTVLLLTTSITSAATILLLATLVKQAKERGL